MSSIKGSRVPCSLSLSFNLSVVLMSAKHNSYNHSQNTMLLNHQKKTKFSIYSKCKLCFCGFNHIFLLPFLLMGFISIFCYPCFLCNKLRSWFQFNFSSVIPIAYPFQKWARDTKGFNSLFEILINFLSRHISPTQSIAWKWSFDVKDCWFWKL